MVNFKFLQKLFFLLVMGFSLCAVQACGDDEENKPIQNPNEEEETPNDKPSKPSDTMEAIDLGLSVKWASCNVGASSPEEYGGHYAWGEIETKEVYDLGTYKHYDLSTGYKHIGTDISGTQYDVAHMKWGGTWRMPTKEEMEELAACEKTQMSYNGVGGWRFTGPNGKSIFLPAAYERGIIGRYWTSTLWEWGNSYKAYELATSAGGAAVAINVFYNNIACGYSVRPVCK